MGRLTVAVMAAWFMMAPAPVMAQNADPLDLAVGGALIPFFGNGANGDMSFVEVASPVGPNPALGVIFFDATCAGSGGVNLSLTINDLAMVDISLITANKNGLVALVGLAYPVHSRVYWINVLTGRSRVLEPITISTVGGGPTWNPLRTSAGFVAFDGGPVHTTIYMICPRTTIQGPSKSVFPIGVFPTITPPFFDSYPSGALRGRVFDDKENFLGDWVTDCDCLSQKNVVDLHPAYRSAAAQSGTFSEIQSDVEMDFAFTGYKAISVTGTFIDFFGRMSNSSRAATTGGGLNPGVR